MGWNMESAFTTAAAAAEDAALHDQMRLDLTQWHAVRGMCDAPPAEAVAAWRRRVVSLQLAAALMRLMAEPALAAGIRARDPRLDAIALRLEAVAATGPLGPLWP